LDASLLLFLVDAPDPGDMVVADRSWPKPEWRLCTDRDTGADIRTIPKALMRAVVDRPEEILFTEAAQRQSSRSKDPQR
jgi:hypothetical protein